MLCSYAVLNSIYLNLFRNNVLCATANKFEENKYKLRVNFNLYVDRIRTTYVGFTCKKKERINQCELG